jgi:hypothetical protein
MHGLFWVLLQVQAVHLHPVLFSVENDLLTPTFKLKRPQAKAAFQVGGGCVAGCACNQHGEGLCILSTICMPTRQSSYFPNAATSFYMYMQKDIDAMYAALPPSSG